MHRQAPGWIVSSIIASSLLAACGGDTGDAGATSTGTASASRLLVASGSAAVASTFGVTVASGLLTVDTGAGLVFKVKQANGDISSIRYKGGPELQDQSKGSHIASGLGSGTAVTYSVDGAVAKITLTTSTLVHYLLVRQNDNTIYMGTYVTAEPSVGELRWITRLQGTVFTGVPVESNLRGNDGNAESDDVFHMPDGTTRSKFYGNQRALELSVRGVTGTGVGAYMVYGNRESSSGGPFFRDIQTQSGTDSELYNYMNSGHNQTEAVRMGFHGPYALVFTDGAVPALPDMSWMESQNLNGVVPASGRGTVVGRGLLGFDLAHKFTVGFANETAQYWATAKAPSGGFTTPPMKPGTYTMKVYKDELALYSETVTVTAGAATALPVRTMDADPDKTPALWRIGTWDGRPNELLNGADITLRHPSDVRNASWGPVTFAAGAPASGFPAAQWQHGVNNATTVTFNLTPQQLVNHTIRIGITASYNGGRPGITVNNWNGPTPTAPSAPKSRSVTIGTYRGNNTLYTYTVPASALVVGENTLKISVTSGTAGDGFLSAAYAYDALDML